MEIRDDPKLDPRLNHPAPFNVADIGFAADTDRRYAFSGRPSFKQVVSPHTPRPSFGEQGLLRPLLTRSASSIAIPQLPCRGSGGDWGELDDGDAKKCGKAVAEAVGLVGAVLRGLRTGSRPMKQLVLMISLNVAYSTAEFLIGIFTGRIVAASRKKPDRIYTYGYKRLEVLAAFTNALFLLFMAFSLAVEALHAFIQDESEHNILLFQQ